MFGLYLGNYLVEKGRISQAQFSDLMLQQKKTRVKLGLIAVKQKLLTPQQAEEINEIQKKTDKRFGDIAIEKEYLLAEQVTHLLDMQGNPYLQFVQVMMENNILTMEEIKAVVEEYRVDNHLTASDISALKSGDIDRIIPVFVNLDIPINGECISLMLRNIVRFVSSSIELKKAYIVREYSFGSLASQQMFGDHKLFVGLASKGNELLHVANAYASENFTVMDDDSFDSVCEFINCINGLYASNLSQVNIHIDMAPPYFCTDKTITAKGDICVVPVMINGEQVDLLVSVNSHVSIN
ncbi:MAG: chemotaxis protein CheX [Mobilitalea sp.]